MGFGSRLAQIRKEKKISQSELAKRVGIHQNVLGRYEREEARPFVETALNLANALGVSLDYLFGTTEIEVDMEALKRVEEVGKLSPSAREQIYMVIDALIRDFKAKQAYS